MTLIAENERLNGKLVAFESHQLSSSATPGGVFVTALPLASVVLPKPVETWVVVVKGRAKEASKEVVKKVVEEVGTTLGVRIHDVRATRDGEAIICIPTVADRERVVANKNFVEVNLEVSVEEKGFRAGQRCPASV